MMLSISDNVLLDDEMVGVSRYDRLLLVIVATHHGLIALLITMISSDVIRSWLTIAQLVMMTVKFLIR